MEATKQIAGTSKKIARKDYMNEEQKKLPNINN